MLDSKFITLLRTLNARELRSFSQYLNRLYPNKNVQQQVFDFIKQFAPKYNSSRLSGDEALKRIFKEGKASQKKLTDCLSDLYLLLIEYLLWEESKNNTFENDLTTIRILKQRKLDKVSLKLLKRTKKNVDKEKVKNEWHYLKQLQLNHELFFINKPLIFREETENLNSYIDHLNLFFGISKLKLIAEAKNRNRILGNNDEMHLSGCTDQCILEKSSEEILSLKIYSDIIDLIENSDTAKFYDIKSSILTNQDLLSRRDIKTLLTYLINYAAMQIRKGELSFFQEVLELSQVGIDHQALFENDHIPSSRFINLVDVACHLKEFEWANEFIENNSTYLEDSIRENAMQIAEARVCFAQDQFLKVIRILSTLNSKNIYLELRARGLLLRSYVELEEDKEFILNFCNAFEQYLRRKDELGPSIIKGYHNLVRITRYIISNKKSKEELSLMKDDMKELVCKQWVEKQIKQYHLTNRH